SKKKLYKVLGVTLAFAIAFTGMQGIEYVHAPFSMSDGVYGSVFCMATGFHGLHVITGTMFFSCLYRKIIVGDHFSRQTSFWFRSCCLVLALCSCCMVISFPYNLLGGGGGGGGGG
ncbi:unnamed protein product, partial [Laminaria digitata]